MVAPTTGSDEAVVGKAEMDGAAAAAVVRGASVAMASLSDAMRQRQFAGRGCAAVSRSNPRGKVP